MKLLYPKTEYPTSESVAKSLARRTLVEARIKHEKEEKAMSEEVKERKQRAWTTRKRRKRCSGCGKLFPRAELGEQDGLCPNCRAGGMNVDEIPDDDELSGHTVKIHYIEDDFDEDSIISEPEEGTEEDFSEETGGILVPFQNGNGHYRECFACDSRLFFYLGNGMIECARCHARYDVVRRGE